MKNNERIRETKDLFNNDNYDLKPKTFNTIDTNIKENNRNIFKLSYHFILSSSIVVLLILITLTLYFFKLDIKYVRLKDNADIYENVIPSSSNGNIAEWAGGLNYLQFFLGKKDGFDLILVEVFEENDEYVVGYIKNDVAEFIHFWKEDALTRHSYYYSEDVIAGNILSHIKRYFYTNDLPQNFIISKTLDDGSEITKTCTITKNDIRWYKYNDISYIKKEINGYSADIILSSRNYVIKDNIETGENLNINKVMYYPKLYTFNNDELHEFIPDDNDYRWQTLNTEFSGEYIESHPIHMEYSVSPLVGPHKIVEINNVKYFRFIGDENDMFGRYAIYFYDIEVFMDNDDGYLYYEYDKLASIIEDIYDGKLEALRKRTSPWPNEAFFTYFNLEKIDKPPSNIIVSASNWREFASTDHISIKLTDGTKEYFDLITKNIYNQVYQSSNDSSNVKYEELNHEFNSFIRFKATKKTEEQYIDIQVTYIKVDNIISISFTIDPQ